MRTVRARIAVAVLPSGAWGVCQSGNAPLCLTPEDSVAYAVIHACHGLHGRPGYDAAARSARVVYVEVDLPVPEAETPTVIEAEASAAT